MRTLTTILLTIALTPLLAQNSQDIKNFDGIWIAKVFHESFDSTRSIVESKSAFNFSYPVALRINHKEVFGDKLNVGFSVLHDHLIHPEVSQYEMVNGDTIWEQDHFTFELKDFAIGRDVRVSEIYSFGYLCESSITFNLDNTISIKRTNCEIEDDKPEEIEYIRFASQFDLTYPFPNPLYYYTRSLTVAGNYTLIDSTNAILATNFEIHKNGSLSGYSDFARQTFYYSTDIYCGPQTDHVYVFMCENTSDPFGKYNGYSMIRNDNGNLEWYKRKWSEEEPFKSPKSLLGSKVYELRKN